MRHVLRYQSQLLFRRSYKPNRIISVSPNQKLNLVFRPARRFGAKPVLSVNKTDGS
jgi:hypothetical protein